MRRHVLAALVVVLVASGCGEDPTKPPPSGPGFDMGFSTVPPAPETDTFARHLASLGTYGNLVLIQEAVPWTEYALPLEEPSPRLNEIDQYAQIALYYGIRKVFFMVDPLVGLDRTRIGPLPPELEGAGFSDPRVRTAYRNFAIRVARHFHPAYMGLGSEVNTYWGAHPDSFAAFLTLYRETRAAVKAESPSTIVFVSFQYEEITGNNPYREWPAQWDVLDSLETDLDLIAISSYPYIAFGAESPRGPIADDYYAQIADHTDLPVAVVEGAASAVSSSVFPDMPQGLFWGSEADQIAYLDAIHTQLVPLDLRFWIYYFLKDLDYEAWREAMEAQGMGQYASGLRVFQHCGLLRLDGTARPALARWNDIRNGS